MQEVDYGFRRVDRGTSADRNDDICARILERLCTSTNPRNGGVFSNVVERSRVAILVAQNAFYLSYNIRLYNVV
jgi:hypothetical protein